tara:strand:- start:326 stop:433 length:108 start_codon:yes stop_codon:yes gene_type:complete
MCDRTLESEGIMPMEIKVLFMFIIVICVLEMARGR